MSAYKCLLVGDGGTGKTSLAKRLVTGEFCTWYSATVGYQVHQLTVYSNDLNTKLDLHLWDVSGQTSSGPLLKEILNGAHCAIIVFDITSRITFNNVAIWYREIIHACGQIPIVIVGNKMDMPVRKIKTKAMLSKFSRKTKYFEISVKTKFNIEQPILWIAAQLLQRPNTQNEDQTPVNQPRVEDLIIFGQEMMDESEADK